jgi:hypothetical protein
VNKIDMMRVHSIDLDVVLNEDETIEDACADMTTDILVTHTVLMAHGPAGHPFIRFMGTRAALTTLLERYEGKIA